MNSSLNRFFKVIWCKIRLTWVAVSEAASGQGKEKSSTRRTVRSGTSTPQTSGENTRALWEGDHLRLVPLARLQPATPVRMAALQSLSQLDVSRTLMTSALLTGGAVVAQPAPNALPTAGQVSAGQASISSSGANMVINQSTNRAAINWQTFNVGKDAHVQFQQPSASSVTLNRVMSSDPSQIFGRITANGQVVLTNPAGVYFGASARVDVGGILATTHSIGDADFMAGNNRYERNSSTGSVVNEGELKAALGGYIALLAPEVRNQGAVIAHMGTVAMASGEAVDLSFDSNNRLTSLRVAPSQIQALVDNQHAVQAPGGLVIISAQSMDRLVGGVVKNSGVIEATGLQQQGGRIVLSGSTKTENSGTLNVSNAQGQGGSVSLQGEHVSLQAGSRIDATGSQGGGTVLVGGNWQGTADPLLQATGQPGQQATTVTMDATATIDASATDNGHGGTVVLWSDIKKAESVTTVHGTILAKGGEQGGDGGRIETSGGLLVTDGVSGSAAAPQGKAGEWLFDPTNVTIGSLGGASAQNNGTSIAASSIEGLLNGGTSVTVTTSSTGNDLGDLTVNTGITKSSGNSDVTLTLRAANSIVINQAIAKTGGIGKLNLVIDADNNTNASTAGTSPDRDGGGIVILEANLSTGGGSVTFGGAEVNGFNGGDLFVGGANGITIGTTGGAVDVKGNLIIANSSAAGFTIDTAGGAINLRRAVDSGNQYTAVFGTRDWQQAFDHARTQPNSWMATIGSSLENALAIRAAGYSSAWLGGQRIIDTNVWQWTADPAYNASTNPMTFFYQGTNTQTQLDGTASGAGGTTAAGYFANWNGWTNGSIGNSEPNNWNGSGAGAFSLDKESVLQFNGSQGKWNDLPKTYTLDRYVLETNLTPSRLTLNAGAGAVNIGAGVGFSKALSQFNVTSASTAITGGGVITTGAQSYSSGLTVESSGRVNISGSTVTTQGPVNVKSTTNDVYLNAAFTNTASTASSFNVEAARHIQLSSSASIASSTAAMNTSLWADTDKSGDGIVFFESSGIDTKGGNLTFGKEGQTNTLGGSTVLVGGDVFFQRGSAQTLTTGGGAVKIYGETIVANTAGLNINSGNGNITLHGLLNSGNQYTWVSKVGSTGSGSWNDARIEARNGTSGDGSTSSSYLVNITSRLENAISGLTAGYQGAWIGAYRPDTNNHNWAWADGPEGGQIFFSQNSAGGGGLVTPGYYANFGTGEPNGGLNASANYVESVGQFFGSAGLWNDLPYSTTYASNTAGSQYAVKGFVRETNLGGSSVLINAGTGSVQILGGVGTAKALSTLSVTSSGTTVKGNGLITTGAQTYSSSLTVNDSNYVQAVNLQAGAGGMTVGGAMTVYGGAFEAIQLNTDITSTATGDLKFLGTASTGWSVRLGTGKTITKSAGTGTLTFAGPGRIKSEGTVQATGTAQLNVVMSAETDNGNTYGVGTGTITTNGGKVWIGGGSLTSTWNGLVVGSGPAAATAGFGNSIDLTGNITTNGGDVMLRAAGTNGIVLDADHSVSTGSGNISLLTDQVFRNGKYLTIDTTGTLTYAPENTAWQGIGGSLNVSGTISTDFWTGGGDTNWLKINSVSNLGGFVLGKEGNTSGISIDSGSPWSIAGPISLYGASIGINANLTSTKSGAAILAKASGAISQAVSVAVTTSGGSVTYWADSDNNGTGSILLAAGTSTDNTSITTNGGAITLGGGTDPLTGYAKGDNTLGTTQFGVNLAGYSKLNAGTGAISLRGLTTGTVSDYGIGVRLINNTSLIGGNISLTGIGSANAGSYGSNWGVSMELNSAITASGTLSITGTGGGANSTGGNNHGVLLDSNSSIIGTGNGAMTITGTSGKNSGVSVNVHDGSVIRSGSGTLTLIGRGTGTNGAGGEISLHGSAGFTTTLGSSTAGGQSGAITVRADTFYANTGGGTNQVLGTGTLTIEPLSASFNQSWIGTSGLTLGSTLSGLTLGKLGNTANLTVYSGWSVNVAGPITVYGGAIAINDALTASNNNINLHATGAVTQSAAITANGLDLHGTGNFTLTNTGNNIVTLAAGSSTARIGSLSFVDASDGLAIGTVNPTGIWAVGDVKIETLTGDLTLSQNINTLSTSASAVVLNAGKNTTAGTTTGGDVKATGTPTITTGAGGRASIYTGSLSDSTGVVTSTAVATDGLVTYGSGRFRYGSDETTTNYTAPLGSGSYVVYRERPSVTVKADDQAITYGDSPMLTVSAASGTLVNGDIVSNAVPSTPAATIYSADNSATIAASANGTAYYDVGTYTLRPGSLSATSSLGYALTAANGTLTVGQKTLQVVAKDDAKFVGYADAPGYAGIAYSGFAPGESISQVTTTGLTVTRNNTGTDVVGSYANALQAAGLTSNNYTFNYVNGRYDIVDINKLLVRVSDATMTYAGQTPTLNLNTIRASYVSASGGLETVMSWDAGNTRWTDNTNTGTWSYGLSSPNVGVRAITLNNFATSTTLLTGAVVTGAVTVTPQTLSLAATKAYDGSLSLGSGTSGTTQTGAVTLGNVVSGETLTYSAAYANDKDVLTASKYITAISIGDGSNGLASNYALPSLASAVASVNTVSITPRALTASASKTYDGSNVVTTSTTLGNLVTGESLTINSATLNSAHTADNATNYIKTLSLADGSGLLSNYALPSLTEPSVNNTAAVSARPIQVSLINTNVSKVYDGNDSAKVGDGSSANATFVPLFAVSNSVSGDALVINNTGAAYNSANVLNATALTATGLSIASLSATTNASQTSDYSVLNTSASVAASISARQVAVSGTGVSKVYDGTTSMNQVSLGFTGVSGQAESGVVTGQSLTVSGGTGTFSSAGASTGKSYSLSGFTLSSGTGTLASNYSMPGGGGSTLTGNDGVIYQRPLGVTFTGDTKVYDGTTDATASVSYSNIAYAPVIINGVTDDVTINRIATYNNKNVGSDASRVTISSVSLSGADAANYTLTYSGSNPLNSPAVGSNAGYNSTASGQITQLSSATWVGSTTGNWFDPANWAPTNKLSVTGVVPDLANVAMVVIPAGNTVAFNGTGSGSAVSDQAVSITGLLGSGATLSVSTGTLNVGASGATLSSLIQTGGTINSTGMFTVSDAFSQTAGALSSTGSGSHISITQATGDLSWVNLTSGGDLTISSAGKTTLGVTTVGGNLSSTTHGAGISGGVTQTGAVLVQGTSTFVADAGTLQDALLLNPANDFVGAVSFTSANSGSWRDVALTDVNALTLGTITTTGDLALNNTGALDLGTSTIGGKLNANSHGGTIIQTGPLTVTGDSTLDAGTGNISLDKPGNDFGGTLDANGGNIALEDINALILGDVTASGKLEASATTDLTVNGQIMAGDVTLDAGGNMALTGNITADTLNANADGNITQGNTSVLTIDGAANLNAADSIVLNGDLNAGNTTLLAQNDITLNGTLDAATLDMTTTDGNIALNGGVTADNVTLDAGGNMALNGNINALTLDATADGSITQGNTSVLTIDGAANLNAADSIVLNGDLNAGNTTLLAQNNITLNGSLDVGSLDMTATHGGILQGTQGHITVLTGPTNLTAGTDIVLDQPMISTAP